MREPETILRQLDTWRPESLAAYERRRRAQRTTEQDRLMAEAQQMWEAEMEREKEAAKGGRPPKDGKTLKGTGVLRFRQTAAGRRPTPATPKPAKPAKPVSRCACGATKRATAVSCPPCTAVRYEEVRKARATQPRKPKAARPVVHGRKRYMKGCRCAVCRAAEASYQRAWRDKQGEAFLAVARERQRAFRARQASRPEGTERAA